LIATAVKPKVVARVAVLEAFKRFAIGNSELERRIRKDDKEIRRILDPRDRTKLATLTKALRTLGQQLVIGVQEAA